MSRLVPRFRRSNPPLPPVGAGNSVILYRVYGTIEGQQTVSTFAFLGPVPTPTAAQLNTLLTNASTSLLGPYRNVVSADWTVTKETVDVIDKNTIQGVTSTTNAGLAGTRAAGHLPTETALVLLRKSGIKGQHGRGRVSLPAIATADVTASRLTAAAAITAANVLCTAIAATITDGANTWVPVIAQRAGVSPRLVIGAATILSAVCNVLLGTIRRRKIGRGK